MPSNCMRLFLFVGCCYMSTGCNDDGDSSSSIGDTGSSDVDSDSDSDGDGDGDGDGDADGDGDGPSFEECAETSEIAGNKYGPVDVVFVIDNSPSMGDEIEEVRANMNGFSEQVGAKELNMNIVVISCLPGDCDKDQFFGICIDPPVGAAGGCPSGGPYDDSNPPHYLHISDRVPSVKGLEWIIDKYPEWKGMIREDSARHFVAVSDDTEEWSADRFEAELLKLDPKFEGFYFHGIFSYLSKDEACNISKSEPCCDYAAPDGEGTIYKELVARTGGVSGDLCLQDFDPVFDGLSSSVVGSAKLACEWEIPDPPEGEDLDPKKVNVEFIDEDGDDHSIGHVESSAECDDVEHGWYYDDPDEPTKIRVCPQTCDWIRDQDDAQITIKFGCETESADIV